MPRASPNRSRRKAPFDAVLLCLLVRSILSLVGLMGAGVAVGSGVAMMSMQMAAEEAKAAPVAVHSVAEAKLSARRTPSRGFAASQ
jgi:hypothetical protein